MARDGYDREDNRGQVGRMLLVVAMMFITATVIASVIGVFPL